jgi:hypothetical protein
MAQISQFVDELHGDVRLAMYLSKNLLLIVNKIDRLTTQLTELPSDAEARVSLALLKGGVGSM